MSNEFKMDEKSRLQLQNMIKANNVEDQTELIRQLKHSHILRENVNKLLEIKKKYQTDLNDNDEFRNECIGSCGFLFTYYTDLFNKIKKDEIELSILFRFLDVLNEIEDGKLDQHEGSFKIGSILKELYIDSALKKADKLNANANANEESVKREEPIKISWREYKKTNAIKNE